MEMENNLDYITSIKQTEEGGYLVNDSISVPDDSNNRHHKDVIAWLAIEGNDLTPLFTPTEIAEQEAAAIKSDANAAILAMTVTTASGKEFDAHLEARVNMAAAIQSATDKGLTSTSWRLATSDTPETVTLDELKEANYLALSKFATLKGITNE